MTLLPLQGLQPSADSRDVFVGSYAMTDSVFTQDMNTPSQDFDFDRVENYLLRVAKKANSTDQILLIGYLNTSDTVIGSTAGNNISIAQQSLGWNGGVQGDGLSNLNGTTLTLNTIYALGQTSKIRGEGIKQ